MAKGVVITVTTTLPMGGNPPSKIDIYVNGGNPLSLDNGKGQKAAGKHNTLKWDLSGDSNTTFKILAEPNAEAKRARLKLKMGQDKNAANPVKGSIGRMGNATGSRYFWLE